MTKTVFRQRRHPISIDFKWAFVLITIALLAVAAIVSNKTDEIQDIPIPIVVTPPERIIVIPPIEPSIPILADEKFQQALELKPLPGKYVYAGKMPFAQPIAATSGSADTFINMLNNLAKNKSNTTTPTPTATSFPIPAINTPTTSLRDFSYVAFADEQGFLGVKSTAPSSGNIIIDLFVTSAIQPTTFKIGNETIVCPLSYCSFLGSNIPNEFPSFLSLLPIFTKKKSDLLALPFVFAGVDNINGRDCDRFEAGSESALQMICFDQQTHVPAKYENALGYSMELVTVQTADYIVEASYPSAMGLYPTQTACSTTTINDKQQRQLTLSFLPIKSIWNGTPRSVELQFFPSTQNPIVFPNATPTFTQLISISGKRGEAVTQTMHIPPAQAEKYAVRACVGTDCVTPFACDFSASGTNIATTISVQACQQGGGTILYDIGDGSTIRNGCGSGKTFLGSVPVGIEGGICCK